MVTRTRAAPAEFAGFVTEIDVTLLELMVAGMPLNLTAEGLARFVPKNIYRRPTRSRAGSRIDSSDSRCGHLDQRKLRIEFKELQLRKLNKGYCSFRKLDRPALKGSCSL